MKKILLFVFLLFFALNSMAKNITNKEELIQKFNLSKFVGYNTRIACVEEFNDEIFKNDHRILNKYKYYYCDCYGTTLEQFLFHDQEGILLVVFAGIVDTLNPSIRNILNDRQNEKFIENQKKFASILAEIKNSCKKMVLKDVLDN